MNMRYYSLNTLAIFLPIYPRQATEDNEMTLVEGEYIEQIEEIDEGWWSGVGPGGKSGLFPCEAQTPQHTTYLMTFSSQLC